MSTTTEQVTSTQNGVITEAGNTLALHGGTPAMTIVAVPSKRLGAEEKERLDAMLEQNSLFYWNGPQTNLMKERFQKYYPLRYVMPCSSGTAAIHIAVAAAGVGPGDEVIVSSVTDMGSVIGILYQQGVPVFADLEAHTYTLDAADVERKITPKTKAIIAVHLTGNPTNMDALLPLCEKHNLVLIEDCAQAWGSMYNGKPIGTVGHIGCWSLNDFKHIGCGDGGIAASNDDRFGPLLQKFGDKAYDRANGGKAPDTLAPNYRMSEPQAAVAAGQLEKMWDFTETRGAAGRLLTQELQNVPGIHPHAYREEDRWTCWFYMLRVDPQILTCTNFEFAEALTAEGVPSGAGYTGTPLYKYPLFANHNFFAGRWPIKELGLTDMDYNTVCCPETEAILDTSVEIPLSETTTPEYAKQVAVAIKKVAAYYAKG